MPKISQYPTMTTLQNGDLFDVSQDQLDTTFVSKALSWSDLLTEINATITGDNIYTDDGLLDADREMDMDNFTLTFTNVMGIGVGANPNTDTIFDMTDITDKTLGLPNGNTASRPSPASTGTMWFNTDTSQFEGFNGTNWVLLG
jgi:hypothetical protein